MAEWHSRYREKLMTADRALEAVEPVHVKGKTQPLNVYEVLGMK